MTVQNVDYAALSSNASLYGAFVTQCMQTVAFHAGGLPANLVHVTLSSGSVKVDYAIESTNASAQGVKSALADAATGILADNLTSHLKNITDLKSALTGEIAVTNLTAPNVVQDLVSPEEGPSAMVSKYWPAIAALCCGVLCCAGLAACTNRPKERKTYRKVPKLDPGDDAEDQPETWAENGVEERHRDIDLSRLPPSAQKVAPAPNMAPEQPFLVHHVAQPPYHVAQPPYHAAQPPYHVAPHRALSVASPPPITITHLASPPRPYAPVQTQPFMATNYVTSTSPLSTMSPTR
jgi:hypothetical protein